MPWTACKICSNSFYTKPRHQKIGWGKYCSKTCHNRSQETGKTFLCGHCCKPVYRSLSTISRSKSKQFFCSKSCQTIWRNSKVYFGEKHGNWKGGNYVYRDILRRSGAEEACSLCKTLDKRVLAVHHRDQDRSNNVVSNLVWVCHNCHFLVHHHGATI